MELVLGSRSMATWKKASTCTSHRVTLLTSPRSRATMPLRKVSTTRQRRQRISGLEKKSLDMSQDMSQCHRIEPACMALHAMHALYPTSKFSFKINVSAALKWFFGSVPLLYSRILLSEAQNWRKVYPSVPSLNSESQNPCSEAYGYAVHARTMGQDTCRGYYIASRPAGREAI